MTKAKPVHEVRLGSVKAAIWQNETSSGKRYSVTVSRLYKDGDEWKRSDSFGRDDLPLLAKVVDQAHSWIFENARPAEANDTQRPRDDGRSFLAESSRSQERAGTKRHGRTIEWRLDPRRGRTRFPTRR